MPSTMQNLFNKEEILELNLNNIEYELKIYLDQLATLFKRADFEKYRVKAEWFRDVFLYYANDLLPALEESAQMEEKHLSLMERNPDFMFQPIKAEVECHQHVVSMFIERFQNLHHAYYSFFIKAKSGL